MKEPKGISLVEWRICPHCGAKKCVDAVYMRQHRRKCKKKALLKKLGLTY